MSAVVSSPGRVHIYRWRARYFVSSEHPDPDQVKARLDESVTHGLAESIALRLAAWFHGADDAVWCIRRLELTMDVDAASERDQLTRSWAAQLTRALAVTLQNDGDGENVLYFANRAAYLARFVSDLAAGRAWGKWYYKNFTGLRLLPLSAALRTALTEQPSVGQEALWQLAPNEFLDVLRELSVQDARRVLDAFTEDTPDSDEQQCFAAAWSTWRQQIAGASLVLEDEWRSALSLYLWTRRESRTVGGTALRTAARTILRFVDCLERYRDALLVALIKGDVATVYGVCGAANAEVLLPLLRLPPTWVHEVGLALLAGQENQKQLTVSTERRHTPFGGLFLLAPLLDALPLREATEGWPDTEEVSAVTLVRFLVFVQCCGRTRASAVFCDALVREVFSIPSALSLAVLAEWQRHIPSATYATFLEVLTEWQVENLSGADSSHREDPRDEDLAYCALPEAFGVHAALSEALSYAAYGVMRAFARRLPGFAASRLSYLYDNFLACTGSVEDEPSRRVVRLGSSPLRLVMNLTGMTRGQYRLRWLDDRPFVLFPEE